MIKIFGDAISDKLFPKKVKRFTQEEKDLIDKFINSILREDKNSELESTQIEQFNDRSDGITEKITKYFYYKDTEFVLFFEKLYADDVKDYLDHRYSITSFFPNGNINEITGQPTWGSNNEREQFQKDLKEDGVFTGILVKSWQEYLNFYPRKDDKNSQGILEAISIRTKYQDLRNGGSNLTKECKNQIQKVHFKTIKDSLARRIKDDKAIMKKTKKKKT